MKDLPIKKALSSSPGRLGAIKNILVVMMSVAQKGRQGRILPSSPPRLRSSHRKGPMLSASTSCPLIARNVSATSSAVRLLPSNLAFGTSTAYSNPTGCEFHRHHKGNVVGADEFPRRRRSKYRTVHLVSFSKTFFCARRILSLASKAKRSTSFWLISSRTIFLPSMETLKVLSVSASTRLKRVLSKTTACVFPTFVSFQRRNDGSETSSLAGSLGLTSNKLNYNPRA